MCAGLPGHVGSIAIIDEPEVTSVLDRVKGFKQAIAACPNVTIVADIDGGGERAKAYSSMEDIMQSHKDLKGVFGINDDSALGAVKAIAAAGKQGQIVVVGYYDANPEARTAIGNGSMYGDAIQHPDQIGGEDHRRDPRLLQRQDAAAGHCGRGRRLHQGRRRQVTTWPPRRSTRRCFSCAASRSPFRVFARSTASRSTCAPVKCTRWSVRTVPVSRR